MLAALVLATHLGNGTPAILRAGSYTISSQAQVHANRLRPNDPRASFACPAANDGANSNLCAQTVIGIARNLNCFFTDAVRPVATHDGNYVGIAAMQVIGWPYDNVATAPIRLWYIYWINLLNQPLVGYGQDKRLYATVTCV